MRTSMVLGVTVALLVGMGVAAGPAQAFPVKGEPCPGCAGSVFEMPFAPFGPRAFRAVMSNDRDGFSSPSAFLHLAAVLFPNPTGRGAAGLADVFGGAGGQGAARASTTPCAPGGGRMGLCGPDDIAGAFLTAIDIGHGGFPWAVDIANGGFPWAGHAFPPAGVPSHPALTPLTPVHPGASPPAPVPEPSSLLLLGAGLAGLGAVVWRRRSRP